MSFTDKIRTVIFDIDDTLYDFTKANAKGLAALRNYTAEHFGWSEEEFDLRHESAQKEIYSYLGYTSSCRSRMLRYQRIIEQAGQSLFPHAVAMYDLYWNTLLDSIVPFPGTVETIKELKENGIRIGTGTDMTAYMQFRKLEKLGILEYVDFMVSSEEAGEEKPSHAMFRMCVKKGGCLPEECIFVGDNLKKDYMGAVSFGMHALLFVPDRGNAVKSLRAAGDESVERISSLTQVKDYL